MSVDAWWPLLRAETRDWLMANNGDAVPIPIVEEIASVGGPAAQDAWWDQEQNPEGPVMPDGTIDRIEELANDEVPPG